MMFSNLNFFKFTNLTRTDGAGVDIDPKTTLGPTPLRKFGVTDECIEFDFSIGYDFQTINPSMLVEGISEKDFLCSKSGHKEHTNKITPVTHKAQRIIYQPQNPKSQGHA